MYKEIPHFSEFDVVNISSDAGLEKVASFGTHIPDKLAREIDKISRIKDPDHVYFYNRALGAGEVYGPNNNGDWFSRDDLIKNHHTFEKNAKLYRHHQNKDPRNAIGDVPAAAYNHPLDTVDLIIKAPLSKVAEDLRGAEAKKKLIATSMGAKVPADVCSYCGNRASNRMQYCTHLRSMMLKIHDGRQVFARNPDPNFIDISIVFIPAAGESAMLRKIAELSHNKVSELVKRDIGNVKAKRGAIKPEIISAVSNIGDSKRVIASLHAAYGELRPDEFDAIMSKNASLIMVDKHPYFERSGIIMMRKIASSPEVVHPIPALVARLSSGNAFLKNSVLPSEKYSFSSKENELMYMEYLDVL